MADFIFLMHRDAPGPEDDEAWGAYLGSLKSEGVFQGGSGVGGGVCLRKTAAPAPVSAHIGGYLRVEADDQEHAIRLLTGNPTYEAGGTVEIRELPRDG